MRLDALLSRAGLGSRSEIQKLIRSGLVQVDGVKVLSPAAPYGGGRVLVRGSEIDVRLERHIMLHKPTGVVTAADDPAQPTVFSLLPKALLSLQCMPVGRLDKDTSGLLLFTTDGELAHRLISPKREVLKVYEAVVDSDLQEADIALFREGIRLSDFTAKPAELKILDARRAQITVSEGKYHQVRRMLAAAGHQTVALERKSFGPLSLDPALPAGAFRELREEELDALFRAAGMR